MSYYQPGGTLPKESPTYVTRQADQEFYDGLVKSEFCYVLNARQMGKSSLQVRTRQRLEKDGVACAVVDLTKIGGNASEEAFYAGIIHIIAEHLPQIQPFDLDTWWESHRLLSPLHHLATFLEEVLLVRIAQRKIVIFIDESDAVLQFAEKGNFFSLIRTCYNDRPEKPAYRRLTFAILGVASPADLIVDKKLTPFNIGQAIDLVGFQPEEVKPLEEGLRAITAQPAVVLARVLYWTGGQPFLTQKLCHLLSQREKIPVGEEVAQVDQMVQSQVLEHWEVHDEPTHLRHIRDRIFHEGGQQTGRLLELYQAILSAPLEEGIVATESRTQLELRLSGLVVKTGQGRLQVYNPIYAQVFNLEWVAQALTLLRPYAQNLRNWQSTQEESWLLRGPALQAAQTWAKEKHLGDEDYKFLAASHQLETRVLQRQKRWQRRAIWGLVLFLGITAGLMVVAGWQWRVSQSKGELLTQSLGEVQRLRDQGLRTQSLFLADLSRQETEKGNATNGILLALEALPKTLDSPYRPYVNEAKLALYDAVVKHRELRVLTGHTGAIKSAAISPDGQWIATASADGTARLWEMKTGKLRSVFKGQGKEEEGMNQVAFSPDGQRLLVASDQGLAYLWEVNSGQRLMVLEGHQDSIESVAFSPNGERIVTASVDKTARLWEARTGKLVAVLQGVRHAAFSPDGQRVLTTGSQSDKPVETTESQLDEELDEELDEVRDRLKEALAFATPANSRFSVLLFGDNTAISWDASTGKQLAIFPRDKQDIYYTDGQHVVTVSSDNTVSLWDLNDGKQLMVFKGHEGSIYNAAFSANGQQLLTVSEDKTARLWEVQTGKQLLVMSGHEGAVTYAEFSPGGQCVVTVSTDNTTRLWDVQTGKPLVTFRGHQGSVTRAMFSPTDQRVVTIADDMTIRVWDTNYYCGSSLDKVQNKSMVLLKGHEESVNHAAFSPDNQFVVTASSGGTVRLWEVNTGKQLKLFKGYGVNFNYVDFSADGQRVIAVSGGGETSPEHTVHLWDVKTTEELASFKHEQRIKQATLSSDGQRLVTFSQDGTVRVWEANTAKLIATLQGRSGFRLNGQQVITVSKDDKVYLWEDNTEKPIAVLENPKKQSFFNAFFSPNGERVVRVTDTSEAEEAGLWDMKTGKQLAVLMPQKTDGLDLMWSRPFTIHANIKNVGLGEREIEYLDIEYGVDLIAFSPDNQHIFVNLALWDADTGKQQMMLEGWSASHATFSPDSSLVLTISEDNAILWNIHTGEQVAILDNHGGSVLHAAFSPDGQRIVTNSADGTAILWPVFPSTQTLLEYARQVVPRQLSCQERERFFLVEKGECRE